MLPSQLQDKLSCSFYVATSYNKKIFFGKAHILGGNGMVQQHTCSWVGEEILGSKQLKKPIFVGIYWTPKSLEFFSPIARAVWHGRLKKFRFRLCAPNLSVSLPNAHLPSKHLYSYNEYSHVSNKRHSSKKLPQLKNGIHFWARVTAVGLSIEEAIGIQDSAMKFFKVKTLIMLFFEPR